VAQHRGLDGDDADRLMTEFHTLLAAAFPGARRFPAHLYPGSRSTRSYTPTASRPTAPIAGTSARGRRVALPVDLGGERAVRRGPGRLPGDVPHRRGRGLARGLALLSRPGPYQTVAELLDVLVAEPVATMR